MRCCARIAILDDWLGVAQQLADWRDVEAAAEVVFFREPLAPEDAGALADFDAVVPISDRLAFPARLLEALPRLRLIAVAGQTPGSIDTQAAERLEIEVMCLRGAGAAPYAAIEVAWALILSLFRHMTSEVAGMREGKWQCELGETLAGKTLGLIGLGRLGSRMAPVARVRNAGLRLEPQPDGSAGTASGRQFPVQRRAIPFVGLDQPAPEARRLDAPRRQCTGDLADAGDTASDQYSACRTSRYRSLACGIARKTHRGAGIDCFDVEPLQAGQELRCLPNAILTPHIGFVVRDQMAWLYRETVSSLVAWLESRGTASSSNTPPQQEATRHLNKS